jgi:galactose-1-phosphate uridylyltransferase
MVGYELLAETQRDLTAEDAAARLRQVALDSAADAGPTGVRAGS